MALSQVFPDMRRRVPDALVFCLIWLGKIMYFISLKTITLYAIVKSFMNLISAKNALVEYGRRAYQNGFVAANDGNLSVRLDDRRIVITPTGVSKGYMRAEDMVTMDLSGTILSRDKRPSSEAGMHLDIYRNRTDVVSVCHAHPPYATAFAVAGMALDKCIMPEMIFALGKVPLVEYGTPGTEELYIPLRNYLKEHDAFLLANHGVVTVGKTVEEAWFKMETVEHAAKIQFLAMQLGRVRELNDEQVNKLLALRPGSTRSALASCNTGTTQTASAD